MNKKVDIKVILLCILIPVFILVTNFLLISLRKDNDSTTLKKELVYNLAVDSGYNGSYDLWFKDNKDDVIILEINDTKLQWIYASELLEANYYVLFDVTDNVGISVYETWVMLNPEKGEEEFYSLIKNGLVYLFDDYVLENPNYDKSYNEWIKDLMNGDLIIKSEYTVTFNFNGGGGTASSQVLKEGSLIIKPDNPAKKGYVFTGWYYKNELWVFSNNTISENMTLVAQYEIAQYSITYLNLDGAYNSSLNITSYNIDSDEFVLNDPYKEHYKFTGWYLEETFDTKVTSISPNSMSNLNLYAGWEAIEYGVNYYIPDFFYETDVKFDVNSTTIDLDINLSQEYEYELYLDISHETLYTNDVNVLIDYVNQGYVTVYVKVISRDYFLNDVIYLGGSEWIVETNANNLYTLALNDTLTYSVGSIVDNDYISNEIFEIYGGLLVDLYSFDLSKLLVLNDKAGVLKYFDFEFNCYKPSLGEEMLILNYSNNVFTNLVQYNSSQTKYNLKSNTTYNLKPIIVISV